jgi:hypothetical protein
MPDAHASKQRPQIKAREGGRHLRRKRILSMLMIVVTAANAVPERMKPAVIMPTPGVFTERRVWKRRYTWRLRCWRRLRGWRQEWWGIGCLARRL